MELQIFVSDLEFSGLSIAVPMTSKASLALARAATLSNKDGLRTVLFATRKV